MGLLPYQRDLASQIHDPQTSELVIIARGLGLRKVVCTLLQIYDGPKNLVLLVNAGVEEEKGIGSELGIMGVRNPGLRIVDYEMSKKDRQDLYRKGGLVSVTSRILVVDLLTKDIPIDLITGMIILHADKVTQTSLESFIVRIYRDTNRDGFIKAFSDQPEQFTQGMYPLKTVMKELQLRTVHILPRFHETVQHSLIRRKADVVELYVRLTPSMKDIHAAIVHCINATLKELGKSHGATLDLQDFKLENTYFRSFDAIVRRQLDPVWHKVGPKTKQLVADLGTLRRLLGYLLTFDPITFHSYLETIVTTNSASSSAANPLARQEKSEWLYTDAAHIIISQAKARCYVIEKAKPTKPVDQQEHDWAILDEMEGEGPDPTPAKNSWLPEGIKPVLEEPPKWEALAQALLEIEQEMIAKPLRFMEPGNNVVLVMVGDQQTSVVLQQYLSTRHVHPSSPGKSMLQKRLKSYFYWKTILSNLDKNNSNKSWDKGKGKEKDTGGGLDEALRLKDQQRAQAKAARRRVRGGGTVSVGDRPKADAPKPGDMIPGEREIEAEAAVIAEHLTSQSFDLLDDQEGPLPLAPPDPEPLIELIQESDTLDLELLGINVNDSYGLLAPEQVVIIRSFGEDGDDQVLDELRPRWIIMYEPNLDFVRRIEVYKSSNPGLAVRVYLMVYGDTSEELKYLVTLRREKDAFASLIKEKGSMVIPLYDNPRSFRDLSDKPLAMLSSRIGGGQRNAEVEPPTVIVDMREFRSSLPNLIDKAKMRVIPATLTVGDYILTPEMCVERKSVPDLIQSFISGRLYTQCELMSAHYKHPILLIEFEESKSFSLQTIADTRTGPMKKLQEKNSGPPRPHTANDSLIQSKLVLLTLSFPRLRVIWSSSPYSSADIFKDLKVNSPEPDVLKAMSMGAEEEGAGVLGEVNTLAEDLLRTLPGVGIKNLKYVMSRVRSVKELCQMSLEEIQELLGVEPGKKCHAFIHQGSKARTTAGPFEGT